MRFRKRPALDLILSMLNPESVVNVLPYYEDSLTTIYHGDCFDVLPQFEDGTVDAVIADPPYVFGPSSALRANGLWADLMNSAWWYAAWYEQAARVRKADGSFWTFHNWRTTPVVHRAAAQLGIDITAQVVWDKVNISASVGGSRGMRRRYELISLMPGPDFRITDRTLPDVWPSASAGPRKPHGHPAEKPRPIVDHLLAVCQLAPGTVVLDPFCGSGTTLAAARALGIRAIGIEADQRWCDVAARRLSTQDATPTTV